MTPPVRLCVCGSLNMDLVVRVAKLPAPGETVLGGPYRTYPGGKGANQAVAARRMGASVTLIGAVGDDPHGVKLRQALEPEGLDLSHLLVRAGESTGLGLITVADGGENAIVVSPGANATLTAEDIRAARPAVEACDAVLLQLEIPNAAIVELVSLARTLGKRVILNAAPARPVALEIMPKVDVLIANRPEAAHLLGLDPAADPARVQVRLPELGPPAVIMTLGAQGSILSHRGRPRRFTSPVVQAVDATAAGDAFCGAFAAVWHAAAARSSDELKAAEHALQIASAAGALAATKAGAIPSLPTREEVLALAGIGA